MKLSTWARFSPPIDKLIASPGSYKGREHRIYQTNKFFDYTPSADMHEIGV